MAVPLPWPPGARLLAEEERVVEPEAERGAGPGVVAPVDRASALRRVRRVRWWMADDDAAVQWVLWARHYAGRLGALGGSRVRGGLSGVRLGASLGADGRRSWTGEAELEGPA